MLNPLFRFLDELNIPGMGVFQYITFRSGLALILSLFIATIIGRRIISWLQRMQIGEVVRNLGIEGQLTKKGVPTMGGIIIIIAILIPCLLVGHLDNIYMVLMLVTTVWMGIIGFLDDYMKLKYHNKEVLHGRFKILGQVILGLIVGLTIYLSPAVVIRENVMVQHEETTEVQYLPENIKSTQTTIPFVKNYNFDYADLVPFLGEHAQIAGWIIFILVTIFVVTAVSNGANLTDGLDGLATGSSAIIGVALAIMAYLSGHIAYSSYLNIMYIPGSEELVVFSCAFIGATIGFLWYNAFPAQVFMGDTGSLTIGGIIGVFAVLIHKELLTPLLCGIFLIESVSVIMQVSYFKYTKHRCGEGHRLFKMAPLHHHFQKAGNSVDALWKKPFIPIPESKIVIRFWIIGVILAALTLVTLKTR